MTVSDMLRHRFNPFNSLFVKIFLWFWVTALLLMLGVALSMRQLLDWMEPIPANPKQVVQLEKVVRKLERQSHRFDRLRPHFFHRHKIIIWDGGENVKAPPPVRPIFLELAATLSAEDYVQQKYAKGFHFIGPQTAELDGKPYQVFLYRKAKHKKPLSLAEQGAFRLRAFLYVVGSGIASFLLAWTITRRLRLLRTASSKMRQGDFSVRLPEARLFNDEIDRLFIDFNKLAERINSLVSAQQSLLHMTSHEIRSPLTRIGVALGIAQQGGETDACLARIEKEIDYLDGLLTQILKLASLTSSDAKATANRVALRPIIERVIDNVRFTWQDKREIILLDELGMTETEPQLELEEELFYLALENIVNNALKYSPEIKPVTICLTQTHSNIVIKVRDDGEGVDSEFIKRMFEPFTRRSYNSDGFGLGLAITERIMSLLGGSIGVRSRSAGGLEMSLSLPKHVPENIDKEPGSLN